MNRNFSSRILLAGCVFGCLATVAQFSGAVEPCREFLEGLRERGYYDTAFEYLEQMEKSPLAPPQFKESVLFEKGVTLVHGARFQRDLGIREKQLDEAQTLLKRFMTERATHPLIAAANNQLGNLLVERARMNVERSKKMTGAQKTDMLNQARAMYDEAFKLFQTAEESLKTKLQAIKPVLDPKADAALITTRDSLRADYLQAQLLSAAIREETADTVTEGSKEHKELLTEAAAKYKDIYEKYRTRLAGLYARMYQGRCYLRLKDYKEALSYFTDLLEQPDQPEAFRTLKMKTLLLAVDCWLDPSQNKYVEAIAKVGPMVDSANNTEARENDWLYLKLSLARANKLLADDLRKKDEKTNRVQITAGLNQAKKLAAEVAKLPSDYQTDAQKLLIDLGGPEIAKGQTTEPKNFMEAKQAGKDALETMQTASVAIQSLPDRIKKETDEAVKAEYEKQLADAQQAMQTAPNQALAYFQLALKLADADTPIEDINVVQYFLCYLYYIQNQFYDSAVMGEFIAQRYPESGGARQSAKIAMACYLRLYREIQDGAKALFTQLDVDADGIVSSAELEKASDGQRAVLVPAVSADDGSIDRNAFLSAMTGFETNRIVGVADYITRTWPDQPEAVEALNTLIPFMIREGKLSEAQQYLLKIPADSAARGEAELKTGQAMWGAYLRGMFDVRKLDANIDKWQTEGAPDGVDLAAERDNLIAERKRLDDIKDRAQTTLSDGIGRMRDTGTIDATMATAVLSLGQIYVDTDQADKAIALLEDEKVGALTLVNGKHAATSKEGFAAETYKTALRAYIASLATAQNSDTVIAKAKGVMEALKTTVGTTPEEQQKLIAIYISLARDLKQQMDLIEKPDAKKALSKGFETFLDQVGLGATEQNVLNWVAETFYGMGESFDTGGGTLTPEAKKYYTKAADTYDRILTQVKTFNPPDFKIQVQMRLAMARRKIGLFNEAINVFTEILTANNMMLNVQVEAAKTYQEYADSQADGFNLLYDRAMKGAKPDAAGKNIIWGWGRLAQTTARYPQYRDTFHESRYNLALCRHNMAKRQPSKDESKKLMEFAERDIDMTQSLYPEMGGETWVPAYNDLMKKVQQALGKTPTGLKPIVKPVSTPAAPANAGNAAASR
jgi:tetratricopeptide (TPR) repeat protein